MKLASEANDYEFSKNVPFKLWIHCCGTLFRQAHVYATENNDEEAYKLYLRLADLYLNRLPSHPEYSANRRLYNSMRPRLLKSMEGAEQLKQKLTARTPEIEGSPTQDIENGTAYVNEPTPLQSPVQNFEPQSLNIEDPELANAVAALHRRKVDPTTNLLPGRDTASQISVTKEPIEHVVKSTPKRTAPGTASNVQHVPRHNLENGTPLRSVFVPTQLRSQFLEHARRNTSANLETCGILCGKLNRNAFFISHLVIPHQESTPNSCQTLREEELFEYVDARDLFILGWIHTHPTQTCFLSSIDLHTHASYQLMLPEAIAIVCSPRSTPSWGAFRLTDPPGVGNIRQCHLTGFHPHSERQLYVSASNPGHMSEINFDLEVFDFRQVT